MMRTRFSPSSIDISLASVVFISLSTRRLLIELNIKWERMEARIMNPVVAHETKESNVAKL